MAAKREDWPFPHDPSTAVLTLQRIVRGEAAVRVAVHDEEGNWQFIDGEEVSEEDAAVAGLAEMVDLDPTLAELSDLPAGWLAWRDEPGAPWQAQEYSGAE